MRVWPIALGVTFALASSLIPASTPVVAADAHGCSNAQNDAVTKLPAPLSRWAQIFCTSHGQVITGHDGWMWVEPQKEALVVIPSSNFDEGTDVAAQTQKAYFTKIQVTKISGEEYERAMGNFRTAAFGHNDGKPAGYRVDLSTASGTGLELYFFDYFTYGWGISCPDGTCDASSRFVIFNMNHEPKKLEAPI